MRVNCSSEWQQPLHIYKNFSDIPVANPKPDLLGDKNLMQRMRRATIPSPFEPCGQTLPIYNRTINNKIYYSTTVSN